MTDQSEDVTAARRRLVVAMVEAIPGRAAKVAFHNEAEFHATVEVLADIWIALGPTLVQQATERQAEMRRQIAALSGVQFGRTGQQP